MRKYIYLLLIMIIGLSAYGQTAPFVLTVSRLLAKLDHDYFAQSGDSLIVKLADTAINVRGGIPAHNHTGIYIGDSAGSIDGVNIPTYGITPQKFYKTGLSAGQTWAYSADSTWVVTSFLPLGGGQLTGNITFSSTQTVDGKDVSELTNIGQTVSSAEIDNQAIIKDDMDTTASNFVFDDAYRGTSAVADSAYATQKLVGDTAAAVRSKIRDTAQVVGINIDTTGTKIRAALDTRLKITGGAISGKLQATGGAYLSDSTKTDSAYITIQKLEDTAALRLLKSDTANQLRTGTPSAARRADSSGLAYVLGKVITVAGYEGTVGGDTATAANKYATMANVANLIDTITTKKIPGADAADSVTTAGHMMRNDGDTTAGTYHFTGDVTIDNLEVTLNDAEVFGSVATHGGQYFMDNYDYILDTANMYIQNSDTMLRIFQGSNYEGGATDSFRCVHPSIGRFAVPMGLDSNDAFSGVIPNSNNWKSPAITSGCGGNANREFKWSRFLLMTPLQSANYENPTLYVSNDPTWKTYERPGVKDTADSSYTCYCPQPLLYKDSVGANTNLSDARGFPNHLGQFAVVFRSSQTTQGNRLWGITTNNLVTFNQADTFALTAYSTTIDYLSPFFLLDKGNYYLFYGDVVANDSTVWHRITWPQSRRFDTVWAGKDEIITISAPLRIGNNNTKVLWHGSAKSLGSFAYALFCVCDTAATGGSPAGAPGGTNHLYLYTSADMGKNWTLRTAPILTAGKTYFDSSGIYESDFDFVNDGRKLYMNVVYSANSWGTQWRMIYSTIQLNPRKNIEITQWGGSLGNSAGFADSEFVTAPYRQGLAFYPWMDSSRLGTDSGIVAGEHTLKEPCIIDSLQFTCLTNGKVDSISVWGPDRSSATNNTDSLYFNQDVEIVSTDDTTCGYALKGMTGIKARANDRFVVVFKMYHADAYDRTKMKQVVFVTREL